MRDQSERAVAAERAVLGACLMDPGAMLDVTEELQPGHFYSDRHQEIFATMLRMAQGGKALDMLTLAEQLGERLERVGGYTYLSRLAEEIPSAANARSYAEAVRHNAMRRGLDRAGQEIRRLAHEGDALESVARAESLIYELGQQSVRQPIQVLGEVAYDHWNYLDETRKAGSDVLGLPTGFRDLDYTLGGLQKGDLLLLAGRPSMGKSALGLQVAHHVAALGKPALFCSLEMSAESQTERLVCALSGLDLQMVRKRLIRDGDWERALSVAGQLATLPLMVDDMPNLTTLQIRSRARRLQAQSGLGLLVIDYLQLMGDAPERGDNHTVHVGRMCARVKNIARELEVPVLLLCQMNREVEKRETRTPRLSDLQDTGKLEQDADVVMFVNRPERYKEGERRGEADVIVAKHRNGPTGEIALSFNGEYVRFSDLSKRSTEGVWAG